MKKIFLAVSVLLGSIASHAQTLDFQFKFMDMSNTTIVTTPGPGTYTSASPVNMIDVDLSAYCEGTSFKVSNLSSGSYGSPLTTLDHNVMWDAKWGWYAQSGINTASWGAYSNSPWDDVQWDIYNSGTGTYTPRTLTIPNGGGTTIPGTSNYVWHHLLVSPQMNMRYLNIDVTHSPVPHQNNGCKSIVILRIKVKKGPEPIPDKTICIGSSVNITLPAGITASNWSPSDPNITPPTTTTNYTVTLSNGTCSLQDNFTINVNGTPLQPFINGPTGFCYGAPMSFFGDDASVQSYEASWEIIECSSNGTPIGSTIHSTGFDGTYINSYFTFPSTIDFPCNKFYKVTYTVNGYSGINYCPLTYSVTKIIYVSCYPVANAGTDVTICKGSCVTLGSGLPSRGYTYAWSVGPTKIGSSSQVTVCPTVTTTYSYSITNNYGCTSTDQVTVTVDDLNADFDWFHTNQSGYYNLNLVPKQNPAPTATGFGYAWAVEEVDPNNNYAGIANTYVFNPGSCWWTYSTTLPGYDIPNFYNGGSVMPNGCSISNPAGKFLYDKYYRVIRGVWSDACPWSQQSYIVHVIQGRGLEQVEVIEDLYAGDYSYMKSSLQNIESVSISIYPNPSTGIFTVEISNTEDGNVEILDITGKTILSKNVGEISGKFNVDLSGVAKGMYFVKISSGDKVITEKVIIE